MEAKYCKSSNFHCGFNFAVPDDTANASAFYDYCTAELFQPQILNTEKNSSSLLLQG